MFRSLFALVVAVAVVAPSVAQPPPTDPAVTSQYTITYETQMSLPVCWGIDSNMGVLTSTLDSACKTGWSIGAGGSATDPHAPGNGWTAAVRVKLTYTASGIENTTADAFGDVNSGLWSIQVPVGFTTGYMTSYTPYFQQQKTNGVWETIATGATVSIIFE